ncbi:MAG: hypothetical protein KBF85_13125 [Tabrizicola sp.]|nr:hypothetical protein [Tabrizicola sp.]
MALDRLAAWRAKAEAATADLQGRVPARLIAALAARGLIREVTGQGRFRVWTARA